MTKKIFLSVILTAVVLGAAAHTVADTTSRASQTAPSGNGDKAWDIKFHGFVNPVLYGDTRQVVSGREGMMLFYPQPVSLDAHDNDVNAVPSLNMLAITTRLMTTVTGPDVLGARMKGYVEGDFTGATDASINMFRLRHAYINMDWNNSTLLMGQYWYPMVIHEIMPATQPLNMGAPFHPYARYNQVRYVQKLANYNVRVRQCGDVITATTLGHIEFMGTASFQLDNSSQGPLGKSTQYLKNSCIPELNAQLRLVGPRLFLGVAANFMVVRPRTVDAFGNAVNDPYASNSFSLFGSYKWQNWSVKAQTLLSDNLYEGCTMGGYIESVITDTILRNCDYSYKPFTFTTVWADFGRTTGHWRPGIFLGYATNNDFGTTLHNTDGAYGRGIDICRLARIQPRIAYVAGNGLSFHFEVEYTQALYGVKSPIDSDTYRYTEADKPVANTRFILGAVYAF